MEEKQIKNLFRKLINDEKSFFFQQKLSIKHC